MLKTHQSLTHLPYLSELYTQASFTRAAEAMHITQAAMSYQIKQLEEKLNATLVIRQQGSQIQFTREAELLVQEYQYCAKRLGLVLNKIQKPLDEGTLRISAPMDFGSLVMPKIMAKLKIRAPKLNIALHISDEIVDLKTSEWDFAIRVNSNEHTYDKPPIYKSEFCVVASPEYLSAYGQARNLKELIKHPVLVRENTRHKSWSELLAQKSLNFNDQKNRIVLGTTIAIREAAIEGLGIALLPSFLVDDAIQSGKLKRILTSIKSDTCAEFYLARLSIAQLDYYETLLRESFSS